jgi:hypothetical protein
MDNKLTLKLDRSIISQAKMYAKSKNVSLSQLIETYLSFLTAPDTRGEVTPLVKSLSGIAKVSSGYDPEKEYKKHLKNKYTK